jgi:hypothetical protein
MEGVINRMKTDASWALLTNRMQCAKPASRDPVPKRADRLFLITCRSSDAPVWPLFHLETHPVAVTIRQQTQNIHSDPPKTEAHLCPRRVSNRWGVLKKSFESP